MKAPLKIFTLFIIGVLLYIASAYGEDYPLHTKWEVYRLNAQKNTRANFQALAILWLTPQHGWHAYAHNATSYGQPTTVSATLFASADNNTRLKLPVFYPPGQKQKNIFDPKIEVQVYEGPTPIFIALPTIPDKGQTITAHLRVLLCSNKSCCPVDTNLKLKFTSQILNNLKPAQNQPWWHIWLQSIAQSSSTLSSSSSLEHSSRTQPPASSIQHSTFNIQYYTFTPRSFTPHLEVTTLGRAALFAILAGLLLNFMPCVLPVISLKLRGMMPEQNEGNDFTARKRKFRSHNFFFATGMLIYFSILALIISFTGMAWGQIFQNSRIILILNLIVFALSLSLFGVYDLPVIDLKANTSAPGHPHIQALFTGILATLLATPCSGPFLGGVLAWALTRPPSIIALVLFCIGIGMASPYLLMALFPGLVRYFPKPGTWMLYLEKALGFLLLGTCIYLLALLPEELLFPALIMFWVIGFGAWMWGKWTNLKQSGLKRWSIRILAVILIFCAGFLLLRKPAYSDPWEDFTVQKFSRLLGQKNFILDFTANWCTNCKFLEKAVLKPGFINNLKAEYNLRFIRVDLTHNNPAGQYLLKALDSHSIPTLAIFSRENPGSPLILRDLFSKNQLVKAIEKELGN